MVKPKYTTKWTKQKDDATYQVNANTYDEVYKYFEALDRRKQEWGKFSTETPQFAYEPASGAAPITLVEMKIGYTITLPKWPKVGKAPKGCREAWNKMLKALKTHEDGHKAILKEQVEKFAKRVKETDNLDLTTLRKYVREFSPAVEKAQKAYDTKTRHGKSQGVFLPAPDKCK